jgi:hypothetical protein
VDKLAQKQMTALVIIGIVASLISLGGCLFAEKMGIRIFLLGLLPVGGSILLWGLGSAWIFSPYCTPFDICDSGGWLAFSAGLAVLFLPVLVGNIIGLAAYLRMVK